MSPLSKFPVLVSCPKGLEYLLEEEMLALGVQHGRVSPQGVSVDVSMSMLYRLCLWSRLANRIHLILCSGPANTREMLYQQVFTYDWTSVFAANCSLAVAFHGTSDQVRNTMFGAQVVKDAIIDCFRLRVGERPQVLRQNPDILIHAHLKNDQVTLSLDFTGYSLHQRGYRLDSGLAPLKENVAAGILMRAKWPELAESNALFHDLCCGSGTLVIEAAMMAARIAPGLLRHDQAFIHWQQHDESLWAKAREEAIQQQKCPENRFQGTDVDSASIQAAIQNAKRAGVDEWIDWRVMPFEESCAPGHTKGLVVCNPPYGERLSDPLSLQPLYQALGRTLHQHYQGWHAAILTSNPALAKALGLRAAKQYRFFNGALDCKLYCISLDTQNELRDKTAPSLPEPSPQAIMFANRLKKNLDHLQKWAKREQISCYRLYDADIPEYAFAIDRYGDHVVLQEYAAPDSIPIDVAATRKLEVFQEVLRVLALPPAQVVMKERQQQKGLQQYEKLNQTKRFMVVSEGNVRLQVNLHDYLDTGLFLDHRRLRLYFGTLPARTRFLNCFCYTATASVHAALAGAITTNIDLSNTYLNWAKTNFELNQINTSRHQFIQADCLEWLHSSKDQFDVIFLDPPSFSNSKRMKQTLCIQQDHETLIHAAMQLLNREGILYFSTNLRRFKMSSSIFETYTVENITQSTLDIDFKRNQRIHHCFKLSAKH